MEAATLKTERREKLGTKHARRLRKKGQLPAIIYGHGENPEPVALNQHDVEAELHHGARVLHLALGKKPRQYLIKSVQYDHLGTTPVHIDLLRVDLNETVTVGVGVELKGTPKGLSDGGVLEQHLANLQVECLVTNIPETLHPLVTGLGVGDSLLVKDLEMPEGVTPLADPDERVASVRILAEEEPTATDEEAEGEAQPEVISKGKKEEEEGGKSAE